MKWSFATIGVIMLGLIGVLIIWLFQQVTTYNENDYYLLKDITEAAMIDSLDIKYYRETGDLKIVREKFIENFTRRYAESTLFIINNYTIEYYDVMELPPKVTVKINTGIHENLSVDANASEIVIANRLDGILEYVGKNTYSDRSGGGSLPSNPYVSKGPITQTYYAILDSNEKTLSIKTPGQLEVANIKDVEITDVRYIGQITDRRELGKALLSIDLFYNNMLLSGNDYLDKYNGRVSVRNIDYYNCGNSISGYDCSGDNKHYIKFNATVSGKAMIKYEVSWKYKEYEFE